MNPQRNGNGGNANNNFYVNPFQFQPPRIDNSALHFHGHFYNPGNYSVFMQINPYPDRVVQYQQYESRRAAEAAAAAAQRINQLQNGPSSAPVTSTTSIGTQAPSSPMGRRSISFQDSITSSYEDVNEPLMLSPPPNRARLRSPGPPSAPGSNRGSSPNGKQH